MSSITIRNLSSQTKETLRVHAARSGCSLEVYVHHILERAALQQPCKVPDIVNIARKYFGPSHGIDLPLPTRQSKRKKPTFDL